MRAGILVTGGFLIALTLYGCDGLVIIGAPVVPSSAPPATAVIVWTNATALLVTISATVPIDVQDMTIHMIDGSNVGGPMITVPHADLMQQFGTVHIAANTTRTFIVHPPAGWTGPRPIRAAISCVDAHGSTHSLTGRWP